MGKCNSLPSELQTKQTKRIIFKQKNKKKNKNKKLKIENSLNGFNLDDLIQANFHASKFKNRFICFLVWLYSTNRKAHIVYVSHSHVILLLIGALHKQWRFQNVKSRRTENREKINKAFRYFRCRHRHTALVHSYGRRRMLCTKNFRQIIIKENSLRTKQMWELKIVWRLHKPRILA